METITLNNGVEMPLIGFGTWALAGKQCEACVTAALEEGYRMIDTAEMYRNEQEVGNAIRHCGIARNELFIATKLSNQSNGYDLARRTIDGAMKKLGLDYIDLYLVHEAYSEATAMYRALEEAYQDGKIRAIAISNFTAPRYAQMLERCQVIPAVNQMETHVYLGQEALQETLRSHGTRLEAWAPFTQGKKQIFTEPLLCELGKTYGKTAAQIALRYLVQRGIPVIPKSARRERMRENKNIFDFSLTQQDMDRIRSLDEGVSLFGFWG